MGHAPALAYWSVLLTADEMIAIIWSAAPSQDKSVRLKL
jgi:hypothetical protein